MTPDEIKTALAAYTCTPSRILGLAIFREARGEVQRARVAVGQVVMNRCALAPQQGFKHTVADNVLKPWAFSSFNLDDPNAVLFPPDSDPVFQECVLAAKSAMGIIHPDLTGGAVFYFSPPVTEPPAAWGPVDHTVTIGRLSFFRIGAPKQ